MRLSIPQSQLNTVRCQNENEHFKDSAILNLTSCIRFIAVPVQKMEISIPGLGITLLDIQQLGTGAMVTFYPMV